MAGFILTFTIGGLYTLGVFILGFIAGSKGNNQKTERITEKATEIVRGIIQRKSEVEGGPVKSITKSEREAEKNKGFSDKLREYLPKE